MLYCTSRLVRICSLRAALFTGLLTGPLLLSGACGGDDSPGSDAAPPGGIDAAVPGDAGSDAGAVDAGPGEGDPLAIEVRFPPDGSTGYHDAVTVRGVAPSVDEIVSITVNTVPATTEDGFRNWQAEVPLGEGANLITVVATDVMGNTRSDSRTIHAELNVLVEPTAALWDDSGERLLVTDAALDALIEVDVIGDGAPGGGARTVVSGPSRGDGPSFESPTGLAHEPLSDRFLVVDSAAQALLAVDRDSGDRTLLSSAARGFGEPFSTPRYVAWDPIATRALVLNQDPFKLIAVDIASGDRTLLSSAAGGGSSLNSPTGLVWNPISNAPLLLDSAGSLWRVDFTTGELIEVTPAGCAQGGRAISFDPVNSRFIVTADERVYAVDLVDNSCTDLSTVTVGSGPQVYLPMAVAWDSERDRILIADRYIQAVTAIDPVSLERSRVSDGFVGTGPGMSDPDGLAIDSAMQRALVLKVQFDGVCDEDLLGELHAVDLTTGARTVLDTQLADHPTGVAWDADAQRVFVSSYKTEDDDRHRIEIIDLKTGEHELISSESVGSGPFLRKPGNLVWDPARERLLVIDERLDALLAVGTGVASSGARAIRSDDTQGSGPAFDRPIEFVYDAERDQAWVLDNGLDAILLVDVASGARTLHAGSGPALQNPSSITRDPDRRRLYVRDQELDAIVEVDEVSGARVVVSSPEIGLGPSVGPLQNLRWYREGGYLLATSSYLAALLAIDPVTGDRVLLSRAADPPVGLPTCTD